LSKRKPVQPIKDQITFEELIREAIEKLKKPFSRIARATALVEFVNRINKSNMNLGAIGGFGKVNPNFVFEEAFGPRLNRRGEFTEGKTYQEAIDFAAEQAVLAELAAKRACEVCEYAETCLLKGRLYEKFSGSGDDTKKRSKLRSRMQIVIDAKGAKSMDCTKAIGIKRITKNDWDY